MAFTETGIDHITTYYAQKHYVSLTDPIILPMDGNLKHAPTYIVTARHDVLHNEGEKLLYRHKSDI